MKIAKSIEKETERLLETWSKYVKKIKIIQHAEIDSAKAELTNVCVIDYIATDICGQIYCSSKQRGVPLEFCLGAHDVFIGLEVAVLQMKLGEKSLFEVSSETLFADCEDYLEEKQKQLSFEIEFLAISTNPSIAIKNFSIPMKASTSLTSKDKGNTYIKNGDVENALREYLYGIKVIGTIEQEYWPEEYYADIVSIFCNLHLNTSLCYVKVKDYLNAKIYSKIAYENEKNNDKAHYRYIFSLIYIGDIEEALVLLDNACDKFPDNPSFKPLYKLCYSKLNQQKKQDAKIFGAMFK